MMRWLKHAWATREACNTQGNRGQFHTGGPDCGHLDDGVANLDEHLVILVSRLGACSSACQKMELILEGMQERNG